MKIYNIDFTKELTAEEADQTKGVITVSKIEKHVEIDGVITPVIEEVYVYRPFTEEEIKENLRFERQMLCFEIINRGEIFWSYLWAKYSADEVLTKKQELMNWYHAWLNVTDTKSIPEKPYWLN